MGKKAKVIRTGHELVVEKSGINSEMYKVSIKNIFTMHKSHWVRQMIDNLGEVKSFEAKVKASLDKLADLKSAIPFAEESLLQDKHDLKQVEKNYVSWLVEWKQYFSLIKDEEKDYSYVVKTLNRAGYKLINDSGDISRMSEKELIEEKQKKEGGK